MTKKNFPEINPHKKISESENEILAYWKKNNVFQKSVENRNPKRQYRFFDGPPFATGLPHYGHILAGTIKDAIPRYWTMQGYRVERNFGWDCHGVPVEFQVEKENKIGGKPGIEKMGVDKFNELCRSIVLRCADQWENIVDRMGRAVDFKNDYKTMDPEFMESVWWVFAKLWEKGLIYEGHKVVPYSPKLGSPLSNFEANLNYQNISDPALTVKFKVKDTNIVLTKIEKNSRENCWEMLSKIVREEKGMPALTEKEKNSEYDLYNIKNKEKTIGAVALNLQTNNCVIEFLGIEKSARKKGFSKQIFREILTICKILKLENISLYSHEDVEEFYKKLGFKKTGKSITKFKNGIFREFSSSTKNLEAHLPNTYILAWTTTPWTLPSNLALCVNPKIEYVEIENKGDKYILAKNLVEKFFPETKLKISREFLGTELAGKKYKPLFPFFAKIENAFQILVDDFVGEGEGTGIVHMAPTGEDDARILQKNNIELVYPFTDDGYFDFAGDKRVKELTQNVKETKELQGLYFRADNEIKNSRENNANKWVIEKLGNKIFKKENITHSYPHCWRTDCALMYRGIHTWFVQVSKIKEEMLAQNQNINWIPDHLRDGRFGKILESAPDWAISRNRFWGCPIPVWKCDKCGEIIVVNSREILEKLSGVLASDLHKHFVDKITWECDKCKKGQMTRIPEVLDCWFESGSMPYASIHFPFKLQEEDLIMRTVANYEEREIYHEIKKEELVKKYIPTHKYKIDPPGKNLGIFPRIFEYKGEIIGAVRLENYGENSLKICRLVLREKFRGKGLGKKAIKLIEKFARIYDRKKLLFYSLPQTLGFYKAQGFSTENWEGDGKKDHPDSVAMGKFLTNNTKQKFQNNLYIIRHGESENNVLKIYNSNLKNKSKYNLTEKGKTQCENSAKNCGQKFDYIFYSPLARTKQTAEILADICGGELVETLDLREINVGKLEEKSEIDFSTNFNTKTKIGETGESLEESFSRAKNFISKIDKKYKNKNILFVSHGGIVGPISRWAKGENLRWDPWGNKEQLNLIPKNAEMIYLNQEGNTDQKELFAPAQFIAEGLDQTRGWFYTLHVLGCGLFGKNIFENVITNGIVLAEDGQKMSKSKQNYPDPSLIFDKYGADSMRFYLLSSPVVKGENLQFSESGVGEVLRSVILPLRSAYNLFSTYANIDNWSPTELIFVRHGEAEHNVKGVYSGNIDNTHNLTKKGQAQVAKSAKILPAFDVLISSPLLRAKQTAEIIKKTKKYKKDILIDDRVREIFYGDLEGEKIIGAEKRLKRKSSESTENIVKRFREFSRDCAKKYHGKKICIATHGVATKISKFLNNEAKISDKEYCIAPEALTGSVQKIFISSVKPTELDRWILSELNLLIKNFREKFESYNLEEAVRQIPLFIDKLNNWYLRQSRHRFWGNGEDSDKCAAYETLYLILENLAKILAPICPFFADEIYLNLGKNESVHLAVFPLADESKIDLQLNNKVETIRNIVKIASSIRAKQKIKLRQPLGELKCFCENLSEKEQKIIALEANVKTVNFLSNEEINNLAKKIVQVNARLVGKKFGCKVQEMIKDGKEGNFREISDGIEICGEILNETEYDTIYVTKEGLEAESEKGIVVILDTTITKVLKIEGFARELVRTINNLRKEQNLDITDRIEVNFATKSQNIRHAFLEFKEMIFRENLARNITEFHTENHKDEEIEIDGESVVLRIKKA